MSLFVDPSAEHNSRQDNNLFARRPYAHRTPRVNMNRYLIAVVAGLSLVACGEEDVTIPGMEGRDAGSHCHVRFI